MKVSGGTHMKIRSAISVWSLADALPHRFCRRGPGVRARSSGRHSSLELFRARRPGSLGRSGPELCGLQDRPTSIADRHQRCEASRPEAD